MYENKLPKITRISLIGMAFPISSFATTLPEYTHTEYQLNFLTLICTVSFHLEDWFSEDRLRTLHIFAAAPANIHACEKE